MPLNNTKVAPDELASDSEYISNGLANSAVMTYFHSSWTILCEDGEWRISVKKNTSMSAFYRSQFCKFNVSHIGWDKSHFGDALQYIVSWTCVFIVYTYSPHMQNIPDLHKVRYG